MEESAWQLTEILYVDKYGDCNYNVSGTSFSIRAGSSYIRGSVPCMIKEAQDLELELEAEIEQRDSLSLIQVGTATKECPDVLWFTTGAWNDFIEGSCTVRGSQYYDQICNSAGNYIFLQVGSCFVFVYEKASLWDQSDPEPTVTQSTYPVSDAWSKYRDLM